jgi:glycosyltransferase involved in cell wall biosynthesis
MKSTPWLTIAIPTFRRKKNLSRLLDSVIHIANDKVEILVLDNDQDSCIQELVTKLSSHVHGSIRYVSWEANVGGNENILRCIEHARGAYVWVIGDDDIPNPTAIEAIKEEIEAHPSGTVFNFYWPCKAHNGRRITKEVSSRIEYISAAGSLGELLFISSIVYRRIFALRSLHIAYQWQATNCPALVVSILPIGYGRTGVLSCRQIVKERPDDTTHSSVLNVAAGFSLLHLLPISHDEYIALSKLRLWFSPLTIVKHALSMSILTDIDNGYICRRLSAIINGCAMPPFGLLGRSLLLITMICIKSSILKRMANGSPYIKKVLSKHLTVNVDYAR